MGLFAYNFYEIKCFVYYDVTQLLLRYVTDHYYALRTLDIVFELTDFVVYFYGDVVSFYDQLILWIRLDWSDN